MTPSLDLIHEHLLLISPGYAAAFAAQEDAADAALSEPESAENGAWGNGLPVTP